MISRVASPGEFACRAWRAGVLAILVVLGACGHPAPSMSPSPKPPPSVARRWSEAEALALLRHGLREGNDDDLAMAWRGFAALGMGSRLVVFDRDDGEPLTLGDQALLTGRWWPGGVRGLVLLSPDGWTIPTRHFDDASARRTEQGIVVLEDGRRWLLTDPAAPLRPALDQAVWSDSRDLVVGQLGDELQVRQAASWSVLARAPLSDSADRLVLAGDRLVATLGDGGFRLYRMPSLELMRDLPGAGVLFERHATTAVLLPIEPTPDSSGAPSGPATLVDVATGATRTVPPIPTSLDYGTRRPRHAFSTDGRRLATFSGDELTIVDLGAASRRRVAIASLPSEATFDIYGPTFSRDDRFVCVGQAPSLDVIDVAQGRRLRPEAAVCVLRDDAPAVVVPLALPAGWTLVRQVGERLTDVTDARQDALLLPDGRAAVVIQRAGARELLFADPKAATAPPVRMPLGASTDPFARLELRGGVVVVILADGERAFDVNDGTPVAIPPQPREAPSAAAKQLPGSIPPARPTTSLRVAPGTLALGSTDDPGPRRWTLWRHTRPARTFEACAFGLAPSGRFAIFSAPCGRHGPLRLVDLERGADEKLPMADSAPTSVAVNDVGDRAAFALRRQLFLWRRGNPRPRQTPYEPGAFAFARDGSLVLTHTSNARRTLTRLDPDGVATWSTPLRSTDALIVPPSAEWIRVGSTTFSLATGVPTRDEPRGWHGAQPASGVVEVKRGPTLLATIVALTASDAIALFPDGSSAHWGSPSRSALLACRLGDHVVPVAACDPKALTLARAWATLHP